MIATNLWFWVSFVAFVLLVLAVDLGLVHRKPRSVTARQAGLWTAVWVALALLFAFCLAVFFGQPAGLTFLTGYIIEESLSADNIFVIVLILQYFRVPDTSQHRVLFFGVLGALVMRGLFIGAGSLLLSRFHWVLYLFGALLMVTAVRMLVRRGEHFEGERNVVVRVVRRFIPLSADYRGRRFFTVENGRRLATPLLLVLLIVEITDLLFAVDSIPAVFGVTQDPFIVFTSNIFAVLGLRSLFLLLARVVNRFHLLRFGLATVLAFVGAKMLASSFFQIAVVPSLAVVLSVLGASIVASLVWPPRSPETRLPVREAR